MKRRSDAKVKSETEENGAQEPPLEIGSTVPVFWKDGTSKDAEIIEKRANASSAHGYDYYVHYEGLNRRLDEWVYADRLDFQRAERASVKKKHRAQQNKKRKVENSLEEEAHKEFDEASLREHEEATKVKNVGCIELGQYEIDTWYFSPFPSEYSSVDKLWFCEHCLKFVKSEYAFKRHRGKCTAFHPPGNEIYRDGKLSMFEVDGAQQKVYCQNLCLLAKLFLDHKTLYYDVDPFLFYILCEVDDRGCHLVGYFSKEKESPDDYNLACILTLPPYQRHGYGKFLIQFSYELSRKEKKVGTPERPLSDLGLVSYRRYWARVLVDMLSQRKEPVSVKQLSELTCFKTEDIISTLQALNMIKYCKGQHIITVTPEHVEEYVTKPMERNKHVPQVKPDKLHWTPLK